MSWAVISSQSGMAHIVPNDDLRPHVADECCWCTPDEDDGVMVHGSLDQRELYERGGRLPS